jgi:hypothetical protein
MACLSSGECLDKGRGNYCSEEINLNHYCLDHHDRDTFNEVAPASYEAPADVGQNGDLGIAKGVDEKADWKAGTSQVQAVKDCGHDCEKYYGSENQECIDKCNICSDEGYNVKWQGDVDNMDPPLANPGQVLTWRYVRCMQSEEAGHVFWNPSLTACKSTQECVDLKRGNICNFYCYYEASFSEVAPARTRKFLAPAGPSK